MPHSIAVLVGSLRKESFTRKIARAIESVTPNLSFTHVELGEVSAYNQDLDDEPPTDWTKLRETLAKADGYLFATPEYNRSVPGVLKNAIDVASRPYGKSAFGHQKPGAVVSVTPSSLGGFGAITTFVRRSSISMSPSWRNPEMYIANAGKLLDEKGGFTNDDTKKLFTKFGEAFTAWVERHHAK